MSISKDSFDRSKNYIQVLQQQGMPIVDCDLNEQSSSFKNQIYEINATIPDGYIEEVDSTYFSLVSGTLTVAKAFSIKIGSYIISHKIGQVLLTGVTGFFGISAIAETLITSADDSSILNADIGINLNTSNRSKLSVTYSKTPLLFIMGEVVSGVVYCIRNLSLQNTLGYAGITSVSGASFINKNGNALALPMSYVATLLTVNFRISGVVAPAGYVYKVDMTIPISPSNPSAPGSPHPFSPAGSAAFTLPIFGTKFTDGSFDAGAGCSLTLDVSTVTNGRVIPKITFTGTTYVNLLAELFVNKESIFE